jgi:hypothetical protein
VTDVGHARTDEGFVNVRARHFGQELGGIGIVGAADDGLFDRWQEFRTSTCGNSRPAGVDRLTNVGGLLYDFLYFF